MDADVSPRGSRTNGGLTVSPLKPEAMKGGATAKFAPTLVRGAFRRDRRQRVEKATRSPPSSSA